ncbi:Tyrosyl-DNA phosphodiesterase 1-like [Homarus americanus]|uniref:Tyrosyl-DNA phosphodiesterase 1-like n=1 Tax=Homarus americanus TaxID=6706 RepID=A0A8J5MXU6_HOMAM|nr:Tyrosyl-DNA phosphodiesterase 1-like [Homarus americanus]
MVDLEFLMENYKAGQAHTKPLLVMYGEMEGDPKAHSSVVCNKVKISFQYGTHHTKIMLFQYKTGCRVVVHTANLVPDDWYEKTQGAVFVGSVPGYHRGESKDRWGHMKVRRVMKQHASSWKSSLPILFQCSSIAQFFLLTSANLSKAAWGTLQIQNSQLFIRSYEAGVLLLPKFVNDNTEFELGSPSSPSCLSLPYDVPLRPYPDGATPWFMNTRKKRSDIFGRTYP